MAEVRAEARRRRIYPGDLRYMPEARSLPGHGAYEEARRDWQEAGFPMVAPAEVVA